MTQRDVRIVMTGGTLDKVHDTFAEALSFPEDGSSAVPAILTEGRCYFAQVQQVLLKDSLLFDDADRQTIADAITAAPEEAIVVTHGTGTMGHSARWLAERITGKTVVLTGALRPQSFGKSDAPFNLGGAMVAAQILPHGLYGVMNGRVFPAAELTKNTATGRFDQ